MLTKDERQEARVTLAQTHVGSRYKRELLHQALDSLDEMEEVVRDGGKYSFHSEYCSYSQVGESCDCGYREWLERARKVLGE